MIQLPNYIKTKDKYCAGYFGLNRTYLNQLLDAKDLIEHRFPKLQFYVSCHDDLYIPKEWVIPQSKMPSRRWEMGYYVEILDSFSHNPIDDFLEKSGIGKNQNIKSEQLT